MCVTAVNNGLGKHMDVVLLDPPQLITLLQVSSRTTAVPWPARN